LNACENSVTVNDLQHEIAHC